MDLLLPEGMPMACGRESRDFVRRRLGREALETDGPAMVEESTRRSEELSVRATMPPFSRWNASTAV